MSYGNNVVPAFAFDNRLRPQTFSATIGGNANQYLQSLGYTWYSNGTLQQETIGSRASVPSGSLSTVTQTFLYDNVNRVSSIVDNGGGATNKQGSYDQWGNMAATDVSGSFPLNASMPSSSSNFNSNNQLTTTTYDASGNQLGIPSVCSNCLAYDAENHQTGVLAHEYELHLRRRRQPG